MSLLAHTLTPLVGNGKTITEVSQFERMVITDILGHTLLHGSSTFQDVSLQLCIISYVIGHELGCCFYLFTIVL